MFRILLPSLQLLRNALGGQLRLLPVVTILGLCSAALEGVGIGLIIPMLGIIAGNQDPAALSGESGVGMTVELRGPRLTPTSRARLSLQPYLFGDAAWVWNKNDGVGADHLKSAGGGVRAEMSDRFRLDGTVAVPLEKTRFEDRKGDVRVLVTLTSRILGLVREQVLAGVFGAGNEMDAYLVALRLPSLVRDLFAEGAMSAAFVPTFTRHVAQHGKEAAWRLADNVITALLVVTGTLVVIGMIFAGPIVSLYAPLPSPSLGYLTTLLGYGAPQLKTEAREVLKHAKSRWAHAKVDGEVWYWPSDENPASRAHRAEPERLRFLAPFDPLVWDRRRFERLWGWAYRFEAYTPAAKRTMGHYALPMLWGDQVIGWANLKVEGGTLVPDLGFIGKRPRDAAFRAALDEAYQEMSVFLGLAQ